MPKASVKRLIECKKENIKSIIPEIMIPLVSTEDELGIMRKLVNRVADQLQKENKVKINYFVGTMIELPRAALRAAPISKYADFFSFRTNFTINFLNFSVNNKNILGFAIKFTTGINDFSGLD